MLKFIPKTMYVYKYGMNDGNLKSRNSCILYEKVTGNEARIRNIVK